MRIGVTNRLTAAIRRQLFAGLSSLQEILPATKQSSYEAAYSCQLCCVTSLSQNMYSHVIGFKHRCAYFEARFGWHNLEKTEALRRARELEEKEGRNVEVIERVVSE